MSDVTSCAFPENNPSTLAPNITGLLAKKSSARSFSYPSSAFIVNLGMPLNRE